MAQKPDLRGANPKVFLFSDSVNALNSLGVGMLQEAMSMFGLAKE